MKTRILFVDDEANILSGLKRMLRGQRSEWHMAFAEGGQQALDILQQETFDAVVTDMRMPGMDGAELLDKIKELYLGMVRFVLSGHSDSELVMRSVGPSHQYLAKPCEPEILKEKLVDALALRELLASDDIRDIVAGMSSLPSLPTIYKAVVEELSSPDVSIMALGKLIEQDPGMSVKVLQLVNSAYFGIGRSITNPVEAVNFLGILVFKSLVLSEGVFSQFDPAIVKRLSLDDVKNNSMHIANISRNIARAQNLDDVVVDQAFLSGLLHDMGVLVLAANKPEEYKKVITAIKEDGDNMWRAEKKIFGTTHAQVGAYMLGLWGIDDDVVSAVAYHHTPWETPSVSFSALTALYIANACSHLPAMSPEERYGEAGMEYLKRVGALDNLSELENICYLADEDAA